MHAQSFHILIRKERNTVTSINCIKFMKKVIEKWNQISLIKRIICGLLLGLILGLAVPQATVISMFGDVFVGALKAVAPVLVFFLVMSALN